jgi:hypothetical protein
LEVFGTPRPSGKESNHKQRQFVVGGGKVMTNSEQIVLAHSKGYRVTDDGRVLSAKGRERKTQKDKFGYPKFTFKMAARKTGHVRVHRLQVFQKFGESALLPGIHARHINGNPADASYVNMEIGTASENMMDIPKTVRVRKAATAALKYDLIAVRQFFAICKSRSKTMLQFGITSKGTLHNLLNRQQISLSIP